MRIILALSLLLSACAYCGDQPLIVISGVSSSGGGQFDPGATNAVLEASMLYTDTVATDAFFEACIYAGSVAGDAERNSKAYSDTNLNTAKAYSDANLVAAKGYSDANLVTAKGYSDDNLRTSKGYADTTASAAALTACNDAKAYADQNLNLAKGYSDTNLNIAKGYADSSASTAAASAVTEAKAYADQDLNLAKGYSDNNLVTAKGYSDANLLTSKSYSDANLVTAKDYSDSQLQSTATEIVSYMTSTAESISRNDKADALRSAKLYSDTNTLVRAKSYADTKLSISGGYMTGDLNMNTHRVVGAADPVNGQDAATKQYVDDAHSHAKLYSDTNTLARAKAYSDTNLNLAKGYSDSNLNIAKGYSDGNLITAKGYSDTNLNTAKTYTDTKLTAYDLGDRGWIGAVRVYSQQLQDYIPLSGSSPTLVTPVTSVALPLTFTVSSQVPGLFTFEVFPVGTAYTSNPLSVTPLASDSSSVNISVNGLYSSGTQAESIEDFEMLGIEPNEFFLRVTFSPTSTGGTGQPKYKDSVTLIYFISAYVYIPPVINEYI